MSARAQVMLLVWAVLGLVLGPRAVFAAHAVPESAVVDQEGPCEAPDHDGDLPAEHDPCEDWEEPEETRDGSGGEERPDDDAVDHRLNLLGSGEQRLRAKDADAKLRDEHRDQLLRPPEVLR